MSRSLGGVTHRPAPPPGGSGYYVNWVGHVPTTECPCEPKLITTRSAAATGRRGKHQGYNTQTAYQHNELPGQYPKPWPTESKGIR